jgi:hypothetical protein
MVVTTQQLQIIEAQADVWRWEGSLADARLRGDIDSTRKLSGWIAQRKKLLRQTGQASL